MVAEMKMLQAKLQRKGGGDRDTPSLVVDDRK